ncbi:MAG: LacI family DNA-binding transcriptional regulator, partial [Chloroflexota bacterium]
MSPATIRDVARSAGVSIATVSRVLNDSPAVRSATREKVLAAMEELDYVPNLTARRLSLGRTLTIGIALPFLTLPSFTERLRGVQFALADSEYDLALFSAEVPQKIESCLNNLLGQSRVDGAIIVSIQLNGDQIERLQQRKIPVVLIDAQHPNMNMVYIDDVAGGRMATQHLIDLGHRRIGFLSDYLENPFDFVSMRHRYKGYRQALEEADIEFNPNYQQEGALGGREAYQKAVHLLTLPERPTAIFAASDTHAIGVLKAAQDLSIKIPEELSVIGYDDIRDAEYLNLTTIRQHLFEIGVEGANMLLNTLRTPNGLPRKLQLPTQLVVRGTTASPVN